MNMLICGLTLVLVFTSSSFAQSLYSIRPDTSGSFFSEDFGSEESTEAGPEGTPGDGDDNLEMRMRYPELYGGNLAAGGDASDGAAEAGDSIDESLEMQTRYPELYLNNRLYDEETAFSIGREGQE